MVFVLLMCFNIHLLLLDSIFLQPSENRGLTLSLVFLQTSISQMSEDYLKRVEQQIFKLEKLTDHFERSSQFDMNNPTYSAWCKELVILREVLLRNQIQSPGEFLFRELFNYLIVDLMSTSSTPRW
jgi:hypothetical protein